MRATLFADLTAYYNEVRVRDPGPDRTLFSFLIPPELRQDGMHLDVFAGVHATNDDLRAKGKNVALTTELWISSTPGNGRTGYDIEGTSFARGGRAAGDHNITVDGHHAFPKRNAVWVWTPESVALVSAWPMVYCKLVAWASCTQWNVLSDPKLDIDVNKSYLYGAVSY